MSKRVSLADVRAAARALEPVIEHTPVRPMRVLSELVGTMVYLKLETLQFAGSFKIRGAYWQMSRLSPEQKAAGVVAASAGNHAQGVALGAKLLGIDALVYMPVDAPLPKVAATRGYGAQVKLIGSTVDEALVAARAEAETSGRTLIHPFDHPDIVAGQGTLALEILDQVPDVRTVIVPVGGGGLIAGMATVFDAMAPEVRIIGVQADNAAAYPDSLVAGHPVPHKVGATMADGIAIGTPGQVPFKILERLDVEVRTVTEEQIAEALLLIAERGKLVVEPSGAAGVAALLARPEDFEGPIVVVLTGGNIDPLLLNRLIRRGMVASGRYLQIRVKIDDRPGSLAKLLSTVAERGGNIVTVEHSRSDTALGVFDVAVTIELEAKGPDHCARIIEAIQKAGFTML